MELQIATTPFGGRPMTLGLLKAQQNITEKHVCAKNIDKWQLYKALCEAKSIIGVSDRSLAVLSALLSFYPNTELSSDNSLIVFPSNKQLSLRSHGMTDPTLRRHLAALMKLGLIIRRDSPNGKRYAHKTRAGEIKEAFGFSLSPLIIRADEIFAAAEEVRSDNEALRLTRERITLQRRDITKLIEVAIAENLSGDWSDLWKQHRLIIEAIPRRATLIELVTILRALNAIRENVDKALSLNDKTKIMSGNDTHNERQHIESKPESYIDFEPNLNKIEQISQNQLSLKKPIKGLTLSLILKACPDIEEYATNGISNWRDLMLTSAQVSRYLGITPSAYEDALTVIGQENTAIVIACLLQKTNLIKSAGGYLRMLTEKARTGQLMVGSMVMACLKTTQLPKNAIAISA